jgi:hypothetical protein
LKIVAKLALEESLVFPEDFGRSLAADEAAVASVSGHGGLGTIRPLTSLSAGLTKNTVLIFTPCSTPFRLFSRRILNVVNFIIYNIILPIPKFYILKIT